MDNSLSKQILLVIIGIALLIVAVVGVSYAITVSDIFTNKVRIVTDSSNMGIDMNNTLPMSDSEGILSNKVFDFCTLATVEKNSIVRYEVALEKILSDNNLDDGEVRIYLEKLNSNGYVSTDITKIPSSFIADWNSSLTPDGSMILYYGAFSNDSSDDKEMSECFRLRIWISEDTVIGSSPKEFKTRVNIYS